MGRQPHPPAENSLANALDVAGTWENENHGLGLTGNWEERAENRVLDLTGSWEEQTENRGLGVAGNWRNKLRTAK